MNRRMLRSNSPGISRISAHLVKKGHRQILYWIIILRIFLVAKQLCTNRFSFQSRGQNNILTSIINIMFSGVKFGRYANSLLLRFQILQSGDSQLWHKPTVCVPSILAILHHSPEDHAYLKSIWSNIQWDLQHRVV